MWEAPHSTPGQQAIISRGSNQLHLAQQGVTSQVLYQGGTVLDTTMRVLGGDGGGGGGEKGGGLNIGGGQEWSR